MIIYWFFVLILAAITIHAWLPKENETPKDYSNEPRFMKTIKDLDKECKKDYHKNRI